MQNLYRNSRWNAHFTIETQCSNNDIILVWSTFLIHFQRHRNRDVSIYVMAMRYSALPGGVLEKNANKQIRKNTKISKPCNFIQNCQNALKSYRHSYRGVCQVSKRYTYFVFPYYKIMRTLRNTIAMTPQLQCYEYYGCWRSRFLWRNQLYIAVWSVWWVSV